MQIIRACTLVSSVALAGLLGCGRRDAAIKQCHQRVTRR